MKAYLRIKTQILLSVAALLLISISLQAWGPLQDLLYPMTPPSFFSDARATVRDYGVMVRKVGVERFDPPIDYFEMVRRYPLARHYFRASNLIRQIGFLNKLNLSQKEEFLATFEANYLPHGQDVDWALVRYEWNPREEWLRGGRVAQRKVKEIIFERSRNAGPQ